MNSKRISAESLLMAVIGPVLYLAIWLIVLPPVADMSTRVAVLTLTLFTGVYCYAIAHYKRLSEPLWITLGLVAGFFELGIVPVLLVGLMRSKHVEAGNRVTE